MDRDIGALRSGVRLWDIIVQAPHEAFFYKGVSFQDLYGGNALVFQTPSGGKVASGLPGFAHFCLFVHLLFICLFGYS